MVGYAKKVLFSLVAKRSDLYTPVLHDSDIENGKFYTGKDARLVNGTPSKFVDEPLFDNWKQGRSTVYMRIGISATQNLQEGSIFRSLAEYWNADKQTNRWRQRDVMSTECHPRTAWIWSPSYFRFTVAAFADETINVFVQDAGSKQHACLLHRIRQLC